jgi:hypothetical protein
MFADPISVTVNTVAKSLVRINQDQYSSEYFLREATGEYTVRIRHSTFVRAGVTVDRHNIEITNVLYATATAASITRKAYVILENSRDDTVADPGYILTALADFIKASGVVSKLINRES